MFAVEGGSPLWFHRVLMSEASIVHALLRCRRKDGLAKGVFELVRADLGLWVLELPEVLEEIVESLGRNQRLLKDLRVGGDDYTLHLAVDFDEGLRFIIPRELAALSVDFGFSIEIFVSS